MTIGVSRHPASLLMLIVTLTFVSAAHAHKVNMFAYVEGDSIFIEGYFADGKKAAQSQVTLMDSSGRTLATAVTDAEGQLTLPVATKDNLRIVLNAGMGHQTEYTIFANELAGASDTPPAVTSDTPGPAIASDVPATADAAPMSGTLPTDAALEAAVERAVGQAIKPLMRTISEMREEKELGAIVGGIGYIFGILGIFFYLKARRSGGA